MYSENIYPQYKLAEVKLVIRCMVAWREAFIIIIIIIIIIIVIIIIIFTQNMKIKKSKQKKHKKYKRLSIHYRHSLIMKAAQNINIWRSIYSLLQINEK